MDSMSGESADGESEGAPAAAQPAGDGSAAGPAGDSPEQPSGAPGWSLIEGGKVPVKAWIDGVCIEQQAAEQLRQVARLPFIHKWVAAMPDVHWGLGATIGSVIPTVGAIVPAAVGVDIGCGMMAVRTELEANDLPGKLRVVRNAIEKAIPHGKRNRGKQLGRGSWREVPKRAREAWLKLEPTYEALADKYRPLRKAHTADQLGTLGSGNHFVEVCLDGEDRVWFMLHSGSRGVGNRIGRFFIEQAKRHLRGRGIGIENQDLSWFEEGEDLFDDYVQAVEWAQTFAAENRRIMMAHLVDAVRKLPGVKPFRAKAEAINCHHNYVRRERHFGEDVFVTRKGAVRAGRGEMGIIPGSMGARSYIVRGLGNAESFESCSHGAGRAMSRAAARKRFTLEDHRAATRGVECRKDSGVLDETPGAYKPIDKVMAAQQDLVEIVYELRQIVCVKGS